MNQMTDRPRMLAVRMQNDYDGGGGKDVAVLDSGGHCFAGDWSGDAICIGGPEREDSAFSVTEPELIVNISQDGELVQGSQEAQQRGTMAWPEGFHAVRGSGGGGANRKNRVTLNVGGHRFETSIETLSFDGCSMLAAMVMRHMPNEEEAIFIDRDPERFRHVLNYLRSQTMWLDDLSDLRAVQEEADFFNLSGLYNLCEEKIQEILRAKDEQEHEVVELQGTLKAMMDELRGTIRMVTGLDNHKSNHQRKEPISGVRRRRLEYENLTDPVFRMDEDF
ncbi:unnamed protein product [Calypogeia fissa]